MSAPTLRPVLARLGACGEARAWADGRPLAKAWRDCERGEWLLWVCGRIGVNRKLLVLAACDCAAPAVRLYEQRYPKDKRPRNALRVARAWCRGQATLAQVRDAAADAADAADAAAYAAYVAAADAAYYAAAAYAAYAAADADAAAAAYAAADAARSLSLARSARLVRKRIPWRTVRAALTRYLRGAR